MSIKSSHIVHALPYPALEAGNLSFPSGSYEPKVEIGQDGHSIEIEHNITGAPFIEKLIEEGVVGFYCLLSIPKSSVRELHKTDRSGVIRWEKDIVSEPPKLRPILVYTGEDKEYTLTEKCGVAELWQGRTLTLPRGARLARGSFINVKASEYNLIHLKKSDEHNPGTIDVEVSTEGGFYFVVTAAPDIFNFVKKGGNNSLRSSILTAIAARCFSILKDEYQENEDNSNDSFPNLKILSAKLEQEYGYDWNDENFDPMLAATKLYPFQVSNEKNMDDE